MGRFLNPDNSAFQAVLNLKIYVDKTGLIEYTDSVLVTNQALEQYTGDILMVGVNYNKKSKVHECLIERFIK